MNQSAADTVRQAAGKQRIPPHDGPNPPRIIGGGGDLEPPLGDGDGAPQEYGGEHAAGDDTHEPKVGQPPCGCRFFRRPVMHMKSE